ncbi:aspartyl-tRNA synthetase [Tribonema minus]|uniref:aspartate--tRNA ligase n=1 Tax=Tribonema minus TaxID=303371 RepID=A0A835YQK2_9STRA|nr:aspartyl-tRNA synthetase [Tribonema minus]
MQSTGVTKAELGPHVAELLSLKAELENVTGQKGGGGSSAQKPKPPAPAPAAPVKPRKEPDVSKVVWPTVTMTPSGPVPDITYGDFEVISSVHETGRAFVPVASLGSSSSSAQVGAEVWVRGRIYNVRAKGNNAFVVLRGEGGATVQLVKFKAKDADEETVAASMGLIKYLGALPLESVVDVRGTLVEANVKSCTQGNVEIVVERAYAVNRAAPALPMLVEDAARAEDIVEASQGTDRPFPRLGQEIRLDNRWIDLRAPANNAIMRVQSAVCQLFREYLYSAAFVEIHTPKLIAGESEGGAGVFTTDYFGVQACLAQSPQLYKQMAISSDLGRVFEIGPVFRAENSNTRRHLCEFTGLDLEMGIYDHYNEVLHVLHGLFKHIFTGLEERFATELAAIRTQYYSEPVTFTEEPCIVHWEDAIAMLREAGHEAEDFDDLNGAQELALGAIVKEKFGTDFFIVDRFPSAIRPFYTMPAPDDPRYSNSYDLFLRGQEICSGAQRCHDADKLVQIIESKGVPVEPLESYISSFRAGCVPHGGAGIGLERVVFLYLGLDNVRKASMFPRDPRRCTP